MVAVMILLHSVLLLLAAIFIGASFAGFLGDAPMIVAALIAILGWGSFAVLGAFGIRSAVRGPSEAAWPRLRRQLLLAVIFSPVTGLGLGFLSLVGCGPAWLPSLYHWGGLASTLVALPLLLCLPLMAEAYAVVPKCERETYTWPWLVFLPLVLALVWGLAWLIAFLLLRGDIDESLYLARDRVYRLPYPAGEDSWVIQGNRSGFNHEGAAEGFAWDFRRPCGTPVLAARSGSIAIAPVDSHDGIGGPNNVVQVAQGDGTVAFYMHIQKGSARVRTGDTVRQGQPLASVGCVGNSLTGHIHFTVRRGGVGVPVSFTDVRDDRGIPRTFSSYTSGNR